MKRRAFTLTETMLALSLLGVILVLILNIFPSSMATVRAAEQRYRAETIASSQLEQEIQIPFESLPVGLDSDLGTQTFDQVDYRIRLQVFKADGDELYLRTVRVTVEWQIGSNRREAVRELLVHRLASRVP